MSTINAGNSTSIIQTNSSHYRILFADDINLNRRLLEKQLKEFDLTCVDDGDKVIPILQKDLSFRIVILDENMERMNGSEVAKKIRELGLKVLIFHYSTESHSSSNGDSNDTLFDGCYNKPSEKDMLKKRIEKEIQILKDKDSKERLQKAMQNNLLFWEKVIKNNAFAAKETNWGDSGRGEIKFFISFINKKNCSVIKKSYAISKYIIKFLKRHPDIARSVTNLDLSNTDLTEIPPFLDLFPNLTVINTRGSPIEKIPREWEFVSGKK